MSNNKGLVLDYRILLEAALPGPVLPLLLKYENRADFRTPDISFPTARRALTQTLERKGVDPTEALEVLGRLAQIVEPIDAALYEIFGLALPRTCRGWRLQALARCCRCLAFRISDLDARRRVFWGGCRSLEDRHG